MSRRKKPSRGRRARPESPALQEAESPAPSRSRPAPQPNPPQPNKPFLLATGVLLAAWIAILIALAVAT